jgi:hypothetical protein
MNTYEGTPCGARLIRMMVAIAFATMAAACSAGGGSGSDAGPTTSPSTIAERSTTSTTTPKLGEGEIVGDPGAIRLFDDPAGDIDDAAALTDYLLPGMSGPAVDCVVDEIDVGEVLDNSREDGGWAASRVVNACVDLDQFGRIMAMYATAVDPESEVEYDDIEACVSREFSVEVGANTYKLAMVFEARLDLEGPVSSPAVAQEEIRLMTSCFDDHEEPGETTTTTRPRGRTTTTTTAAPTTTTRPTTTPSGGRTTTWTFVTAGSCILELPEGNGPGTTVLPCSEPHGGEVMTAGLGAAPAPGHCQDIAETYLGSTTPTWPADIVTFTRADVGGVTRTVCIIGPADGSKVTGSVKGR